MGAGPATVPPDRLGLLAQALATADHVEAAASARVPDGLGPATSVVLVADGPGRLAVAGALAVLGPDLSRPVAVLRSGDPVPAWAIGAQVVVLAGAAAPADLEHPPVRLAASPVPLDPRAAVPAEVVSLLAVLAQLHAAPDLSSAVSSAVAQLRSRAAAAEASGLGAARTAAMARRIGRTFVLAQGAGIGAVAAQRLQQRIQTDVKGPAWSSDLADAEAGERHSWGQSGDVTRQVLRVVRCRNDHEPDGTAELVARYEPDLLEVTGGIEDLVAAGDGPLAQLLDLFLQADLLVLALAAQEGLDPG